VLPENLIVSMKGEDNEPPCQKVPSLSPPCHAKVMPQDWTPARPDNEMVQVEFKWTIT